MVTMEMSWLSKWLHEAKVLYTDAEGPLLVLKPRTVPSHEMVFIEKGRNVCKKILNNFIILGTKFQKQLLTFLPNNNLFNHLDLTTHNKIKHIWICVKT